MGGPCEVSVWLTELDDSEALFHQLKAEVERLENKYSRYLASSWLSRLNNGERVEFDAEVVGLLNYIDDCHELSDGLFDPTIGILKRVWNFSVEELPNESTLKNCLSRVGWKKLGWDGHQLDLPHDMELDFGGVVKEFATDRLVVMLKEQSHAGLVNLAGDIAVSAPQPNNQPWMVAIKNPRKAGAFAKIPLISGALATSGDYERYITVNNQRYCHILRPDTGFPVENSLASVTVLSNSCMMAGTVATVAMLKGEKGLDWLTEMSLPYLAITTELEFYSSTEV